MDYVHVEIIKRFHEQLERCGFIYKRSTYGDGTIAIFPTEEKWPSYNPDMEIRTGTVESLMKFMDGIEFMISYHGTVLKLEKQIENAVQKVRNRRTYELLKS